LQTAATKGLLPLNIQLQKSITMKPILNNRSITIKPKVTKDLLW